MVQLVEQVTIDFQGTEDGDVIAWATGERLDRDSLNDLTFSHTFDVDEELLDVETIEEIYRANVALSNNGWLQRVYRLLAEGDARAAMDELHSEFPQLRPPQSELNLVLRLGAGGGIAHG
ncbi:hypothetical protein [Rhizobium ruizarguesonis]|uniref:hypothetical protein n=1 Tax=Rhizobium ruizarguesonis TaxID=2081791 RepID=UPI001030A5B7|nr:hypothetical protein [Rhizobium ruizarguesonis]TAY95837.1 hypothetical protein ELH85_22810 [Rhizobium ruizarguesonis]